MAEKKSYNMALFEKMEAAQEKYRQWLLSQPPKEILNHTYEYTMREDILCCMEGDHLTDEQAKALLRSPDPLEDVYKDFNKKDASYMDDMVDSLQSCAKAMQRKAQEREER